MSAVNYAVSTIFDGSMKNDTNVLENRARFISSMKTDPAKACLVQLVYEGDNYCRYSIVDSLQSGHGVIAESTIIADALLTCTPGMTLFLPLADCVGAVIWDENKTALMVSHLGRHNLEQHGGTKSIEYFTAQTGIAVSKLHVYLSPAAGKASYPLFGFDNKSLYEVTTEQFLKAGILRKNIKHDPRDTTRDETLFSHSEFLKGNRQVDGRFMVAASLLP